MISSTDLYAYYIRRNKMTSEGRKTDTPLEAEASSATYEPQLVVSLGKTEKVVRGFGSGAHDSCGYSDRSC